MRVHTPTARAIIAIASAAMLLLALTLAVPLLADALNGQVQRLLVAIASVMIRAGVSATTSLDRTIMLTTGLGFVLMFAVGASTLLLERGWAFGLTMLAFVGVLGLSFAFNVAVPGAEAVLNSARIRASVDWLIMYGVLPGVLMSDLLRRRLERRMVEESA